MKNSQKNYMKPEELSALITEIGSNVVSKSWPSRLTTCKGYSNSFTKSTAFYSTCSQIVDEIALHQDQMVKLSQNCLKLEDENEYQEEGLDLTDEEKNYLKRVDKTIAKKHPDFRSIN